MPQSIPSQSVPPTTQQRTPRRVGSLQAKRPALSTRATVASHWGPAGLSRVPLIAPCIGGLLLRRADAMDRRRSCISGRRGPGSRESFAGPQFATDSLRAADEHRIACAGGFGAAASASYRIERRRGGTANGQATQRPPYRLGEAGSAQPPLKITDRVTQRRMRRALLSRDHNLRQPAPAAECASGRGVSVREHGRHRLLPLGIGRTAHDRRLRRGFASRPTGSADSSAMNASNDARFSDGTRCSLQSRGGYGLCRSHRGMNAQPSANTERAFMPPFQ